MGYRIKLRGTAKRFVDDNTGGIPGLRQTVRAAIAALDSGVVDLSRASVGVFRLVQEGVGWLPNPIDLEEERCLLLSAGKLVRASYSAVYLFQVAGTVMQKADGQPLNVQEMWITLCFDEHPPTPSPAYPEVYVDHAFAVPSHPLLEPAR